VSALSRLKRGFESPWGHQFSGTCRWHFRASLSVRIGEHTPGSARAASRCELLAGVTVDPRLLGLQRGDKERVDCLDHFGVHRHIVGDRRFGCEARIAGVGERVVTPNRPRSGAAASETSRGRLHPEVRLSDDAARDASCLSSHEDRVVRPAARGHGILACHHHRLAGCLSQYRIPRPAWGSCRKRGMTCM
jgi:hypothetical protein